MEVMVDGCATHNACKLHTLCHKHSLWCCKGAHGNYWCVDKDEDYFPLNFFDWKDCGYSILFFVKEYEPLPMANWFCMKTW